MRKGVAVALCLIAVLALTGKTIWCSIKGCPYPEKVFRLGRWMWRCPSCGVVKRHLEAFF